MKIDMMIKIKMSAGYKNMIKGLEIVFPDDYEIMEIFPSDDDTSCDFSTITNINNIKGIDVGVSLSGNSHQFQHGDGVVGVDVPISDGFYTLPSGKKGESLSKITNDNNFKFGASANDLEEIKQLFLKLKEYLESVDKAD